MAYFSGVLTDLELVGCGADSSVLWMPLAGGGAAHYAGQDRRRLSFATDRRRQCLDERVPRRLWTLLWLPVRLRETWEQRFPISAEISRMTATA